MKLLFCIFCILLPSSYWRNKSDDFHLAFSLDSHNDSLIFTISNKDNKNVYVPSVSEWEFNHHHVFLNADSTRCTIDLTSGLWQLLNEDIPMVRIESGSTLKLKIKNSLRFAKTKIYNIKLVYLLDNRSEYLKNIIAPKHSKFGFMTSQIKNHK